MVIFDDPNFSGGENNDLPLEIFDQFFINKKFTGVNNDCLYKSFLSTIHLLYSNSLPNASTWDQWKDSDERIRNSEWNEIWDIISENINRIVNRIESSANRNKSPVTEDLTNWIDEWNFPFTIKEEFVDLAIFTEKLKVEWVPHLLFVDYDKWAGRITNRRQIAKTIDNGHSIVLIRTTNDIIWVLDSMNEVQILTGRPITVILDSAKRVVQALKRRNIVGERDYLSPAYICKIIQRNVRRRRTPQIGARQQTLIHFIEGNQTNNNDEN